VYLIIFINPNLFIIPSFFATFHFFTLADPLQFKSKLWYTVVQSMHVTAVDLEELMRFIKSFSHFLYIQGRNHHIVNLSAQMSYRTLSAFIPFLMLLYSFVN